MERNLTCIVCPIGCSLKVELEEGKVVSVSGNTCPRGEKYAHSECTNPQRTITTTIKCADESVVPVKTDKPIPKEKMFECMKEINKEVVDAPIKMGAVLISNICETGVDVVASNEA